MRRLFNRRRDLESYKQRPVDKETADKRKHKLFVESEHIGEDPDRLATEQRPAGEWYVLKNPADRRKGYTPESNRDKFYLQHHPNFLRMFGTPFEVARGIAKKTWVGGYRMKHVRANMHALRRGERLVYGSKRQVHDGSAEMTKGGLQKKDFEAIKKDGKTRIVSRARHQAGRARWNKLSAAEKQAVRARLAAGRR